MDFASYQALTLGLSVKYQSLTRWYFQLGGPDFHAFVSSFFPHLSAHASRDFSSGSSLFLSALCSLASTPLSALPPSSGPPAFPPLSSPLPSALPAAPAPLPPHSFPSAFLLPLASTPLLSAPPLGISTSFVHPPPGFPSGFSTLPSAPVFSSLTSAVPPTDIPSTFSTPSSLSMRPSAPGFNAYLGVAAPVVPVAAAAVPVAVSVPVAAPALFCPFVLFLSAEGPVASSAPAVFASAPAVTNAVIHPGFPSGVPPVPPHYSALSASNALPSTSDFAALLDDQFDLGYPDSVPRNPEVPIPPAVPDSFHAEIRQMYSYLVDLFPQAAGSTSIDPLQVRCSRTSSLQLRLRNNPFI